MKSKRKCIVIVSIVMTILFALGLSSCKATAKHTVEFIVDNTVYYSDSVVNGQKVSLPQEPTKNGYSFCGWYFDNNIWNIPFSESDTISADAPIYAKFDAIEYNISYDLNGGKLERTNPTTYTIESEDITIGAPTKKGYIFAGWTGTDLTAPTLTVIIRANSTGNREYVANWTLDGYSITYNLNGGVNSEKNPFEYAVTSANIYLENATRRGYVFYGWYTNADCTADAKITTIASGSTGDITLWAKWTLANYKITYNLNGGEFTSDNPKNYTIESGDITLNAPTKRGYTFVGWMGTDITGTVISVTIRNNSTGDRTYTAVWEIVDYSIIYNLNGGTNASENPEKYNVASVTITLENPTKLGYVFGGWNTSNDYNDDERVKVIPNGSIGNIELFAKWTPATYSIKFNKNNSKATGTMSNQTLNYDSADTLTANRFVLTGYTFKGWTTNSDGSGILYVNEQEVLNLSSEDGAIVNVYAKWEANTYSVTFDKNGGVNGTNSVSATYDSAMSTATAPTYTGYDFAGYYDADGVQYYNAEMQSVRNWNKAGNTTLYARWNGKTFNISFDRQGGTGGTTSVAATFNANMPSASVPSRTGYIFKGYFDGRNGTGTQYYSASMSSLHKWDKSSAGTLYAYWEARTYTVSFNYNNGNSNNGSIIATYDSEMPSISGIPTRTGYVFTGYFDSANNGTKYYNADLTSAKTWDKTSNTTLYAHWVGINYSVRFDGNGSTSGRMDNQAFVYATAQNLNANRFARTGYTFVGWKTEADGSGTSYDNSASVNNLTAENDGTVVLYAQWKINQYTATFKNFDGKILYSVTLNYNEIPTYAGETPVKERTAEFSYIFNGWDKEIVAIFEDAVYTAQFISETNKYQIVWKNYDGSIIKTDTLLYGTEPNYDGDIPVKPSTQQYTYVFADWTPAIEKVIKNIEYTAVYTRTINKYTVTFKNYDGSVLSYSTVDYGENAAYNAAQPQRPDENHKSYEFSGWSDSLNNITANKVVIAVYIVYDVYNFTYINGTSKTIKVLEGTAIDNLIPINTSTIVSGNLETSYEWKKRDNYEYFEVEKTRKMYNITYLLNGGTNDTRNPSMVYCDENYRLYAANKVGYEFVSWCTDGDLTAEILSLNNIANNTTLYAKYKSIVYSITYYLFDGENALKNPDSYTIEDTITLKNATKKGYTFIGWFADGDFSRPIKTISMQTGNIELFSYFEPNEYTATFIDNDGSYSEDLEVTLDDGKGTTKKYLVKGGESFKPYKVWNPSGLFAGWYLNDKLLENNLVIKESIVLYAKYVSQFYNGYYVSQMEGNIFAGGGTTSCYLIPADCSTIEWYGKGRFEISSNNSCVYVNNDSGSSGVEEVYPGTIIMVKSKGINGGYYGEVEIRLGEFRNNEIVASDTTRITKVTYDSNIPHFATSKVGYTFSGWYDENNCLIDKNWTYDCNNTFYARWTPTKYKIEYYLSGGNNNIKNPNNYTINNNIVLHEPTKIGYSFDGWYLDKNFTQKIDRIVGRTGDLILYAKFTINTYTLTLNSDNGKFAPKISFISNGKNIKTVYLYENESIENFYPNTPKGYLFAGWYTDEIYQNVFNFDGTITDDLILYAKWIKDEESILLINETISNVSMSINGKNEQYIIFVPVSNTSITVTSLSELDLIGTLYDIDKNILISADDVNESNLNFSFTFNIEAGKLYYIGIKGATVGTQGDFNVSITWNGNSCIKGTTYTNRTISIVYGATFILPDSVEKEGYKFVGWVDDNNNKYESGIWNYLTDLTLHAVYEKI